MINFIVLGEPQGKERPRVVLGGKHTYTPKKTADYTNRVIWAALDEMSAARLKVSEKAIELDVTAYKSISPSWSKKNKERARNGFYPTFRKPDLDNIIKLIKDALNGICYADDKQVIRITADWRYSNSPRIEVCVREAENG